MMLVVTALFVVVFAVYLSTVVVKNGNGTTTSNLVSNGASSTTSGPLQGKPMPEFSLPGIQGASQVGSASFAGQPAVVNFFASWCTPCNQEAPILAAASKTLGSKVKFVGVDEEDKAVAVANFLKKYGIHYSIGSDPKASLAGSFKLVGLPTTFFVEPNGTIYREVMGPVSKSVLAKDVKGLLGASK